MFDSLLERAEESCQVRGSLLDLGSSVGHLLEAAAQRGWKVTGIELDATTAHLVRDRTGFDVRPGVAEEVLPSLGFFDLIVMSHWLEHLPDPRTAFARAAQHLSAGGGVLLRLPNARSQGAGLLGSLWPWYCPPFHLFYFSRHGVEFLARANGLSIDWFETARGDAQPLPIEILNAAYRWWGRNKPRGAATPGVGDLLSHPSPARLALKRSVIRLRPWGERMFPFEAAENTELRVLLRRRPSGLSSLS
ncbi:MAG TPA: class I SAM-dependent methyltransferase [Thermoplasmata archaeon]|nr:class I SAM-dependent methyltransferase [Thermoplasmata archaeon]